MISAAVAYSCKGAAEGIRGRDSGQYRVAGCDRRFGPASSDRTSSATSR
jgi:hypothetical protein